MCEALKGGNPYYNSTRRLNRTSEFLVVSFSVTSEAEFWKLVFAKSKEGRIKGKFQSSKFIILLYYQSKSHFHTGLIEMPLALIVSSCSIVRINPCLSLYFDMAFCNPSISLFLVSGLLRSRHTCIA
ncbi:MAG: hypothetical protein QS99_C0019G0024 [archaeon GW2011_AR4]|nr:MAG: hypothetical protein QS99_C0019G0024 [archaeon GW2011_AR4]